ncbi:MAG: hypothetical protein ACD_2C00097G0007 [uncultured bacterium (gcode 4)]|uniref:4'-phosphopantetheinyl transferase domain-containing protein n=1 Tax=uncultured bacterium (gcode 4) TaxID=1234023 RepID=K2GH78_9BACT|nr:MAG: hypothetical protein ACD_2C00097G0007 [uncultured bacterium (gcode 4)]
MIRLKLLEMSNDILDEALSYFTPEYLSELREMKNEAFAESIVSRYAVSLLAKEEFWVEHFIPKIDFLEEDFEDFCYSISHKNGNILVWISNDTIWVAIEKLLDRDESDYGYFTPGELQTLGWKNQAAFHIWWTAKKSLIKYFESWIDDIYDIEIIRVTEERNVLWDIAFNLALVLKFEDNYFKVYSWADDNWGFYFSVAA